MSELEQMHSATPMKWVEQTAWVRRIGMCLLEVRQVKPAKFTWRVVDGSRDQATGDLVEQGHEETCEAAMAKANVAALAVER